MLGQEELAGHLGPHPRPIGSRQRRVRQQAGRAVDCRDAFGHLKPERADIAIDNPRARKQTFNVCMDEPVDYGELGAYLTKTRKLPTVPIKTPYRSTWLDNTKAKFLLGWRPRYDLARMTDAAYDYQRGPDDPRIVWYPG